MLELAPRTLGILEPREQLRGVADRWMTADQMEMFLVPGVAFDRNGGRLGHGKGYYDRLLARTAPATPKFALAFPRQLVDEIPMGPSDIRMDWLSIMALAFCLS
jgi:5-formyltetrahydrofolate cyclo-ligase